MYGYIHFGFTRGVKHHWSKQLQGRVWHTLLGELQYDRRTGCFRGLYDSTGCLHIDDIKCSDSPVFLFSPVQ